MKKRSWVVLLLILGFIFLMMITIPYMIYRTMTGAKVIESGSVLEVELSGQILEARETDPFAALLETGLGLYELRQIFHAAAQDSRVPAVFLKVKPLQIGWGAAEELRAMIEDFKKSKKKVYALLDNDFVEEKEYFLASAADRIFLNPEGGFLLNGLIAEVEFFRKALEKLYIEPQYFQYKEYKSAGEPFSREHMSPYFREVLDSILGDIQERLVQTLAGARQLDPSRIQALMDEGLFLPKRALDEKLVDTLGYTDEIEQALVEEFIKDGKKEYKGISADSYFDSMTKPFESGTSRIALVFATGLISSGKSGSFSEMMGGETVSRYLREARKDKDIKGIILRVNSPGGSAVGSDLVWREVRLAKKVKPVIVSMSTVAGSGGYYIAMGADAIVAQPSTITGSIGVVGGKLNLRGFFEWLGINIDTVKKSQNADLFSPFSSLNEDQTMRFRAWMEAIYADFVTKSAEGRQMTFDELEPLAHGRVWTGRQAKERRLVDELGGLDVAINLLRQKTNLKPEDSIEFVVYPKKKRWLDLIRDVDMSLGRGLARTRNLESLMQWARPMAPMQPWVLMPDIFIH